MRKGSNIYRRADGRWEARMITGKSPNGKSRYKSFYGKTYREASEKRRDYEKSLAQGTPDIQAGLSVSFGKVALSWITLNQSAWKISTYIKYKNILEQYLFPSWEDIRIRYLSQKEYDQLFLSLSGYLSASSLNAVNTVIRSILKYAMSKELIAFIPFTFASPQRKKAVLLKTAAQSEALPGTETGTKVIRLFSEQEIAVMTEYLLVHSSPVHIGILIALYQGIRIGELCALRWSDLDFSGQTICISRTYQRIQKANPEPGKPRTELRFGSPKNGRTRVIPMQPQLMEHLSSESSKYSADAYILTGTSSPMEPRSCEYHFKTMLRDCGLQMANFHILRHTFASSCVESGIDIKALSEILGHSSVHITMDRYVHLSMDYKKEQISVLKLMDSEYLSRHNFRKKI